MNLSQTPSETESIACEKLTFSLLSNGGRYVAGLGVDGFKLWERKSTRLVTSFPDKAVRGSFFSFDGWAFSPDGNTLAVNDEKGRIGFYQTRTGDRQQSLNVGEARVSAVAFSPDGRLLGVTTTDHLIRVCDVTTQRRLWASTGAPFGFMRALAFSPRNDRIAAGADNATVYVWDISTGVLKHAFEDTLLANFAVAFTPDGKYLAAGGADSAIFVFDLVTGKLTRTFGREPNMVAELRFSTAGDVIVARYRNPEATAQPAPIIVWNFSAGQPRLKIEVAHTHFIGMNLSETEVIATSWRNGALHVWASQLS